MCRYFSSLRCRQTSLGGLGMLILLNITQSCTCFLGEAAAVPVLQRSEGAGVADGVSHSLHQGDRRPPRTGGSVSRPEEWTGERSLASPIRLIICRQTLATRLVVTLRWVPRGRNRAPRLTSPPAPGPLEGLPEFHFMRTASGQRCSDS